MRMYNILKGVLDAIKRIGVDYTVEEGKKGAWNFKKWKNGDYECWTTIKAYPRDSVLIDQALPTDLLLADITINATLNYHRSIGVGRVVAQTLGSDNNVRVNLYLRDGNNNSVSNTVLTEINVAVIGRWK